jgi:trk system potassium uptake protein TrkA
MFVLIVGAGRVGSAVAKRALAEGHEVSVLDEDPLSHERLEEKDGQTWEDAGGLFTVGTALEVDALIEAGVQRADVFIASTDGDNTNLTVAQVVQRRFGVEKVVCRVMDPARAAGTPSRACTRSRRPATRSRCSSRRSASAPRAGPRSCT